MDLGPEVGLLHILGRMARPVGHGTDRRTGDQRDWEARLHPQDRLWVRAALDRTLCGPERKCSLRFRLRHALGHYAWVQHQSVVECDDAGIAVRMYGSHTLPSNLEHADEAQGRNATENPLAMLSPLGIFHTDARGKCVFVNDRWCEITGLTSDEALGDGWAEALHPEDRSRVFETWEQATRTRSVFKAEYRFIDRRGVVTLCSGKPWPSAMVEGSHGVCRLDRRSFRSPSRRGDAEAAGADLHRLCWRPPTRGCASSTRAVGSSTPIRTTSA